MDRPRSTLEPLTGKPDRLPQPSWTVTDVEPPATIDRLIHAAMGRVTGSISPASLALAWMDWGLHLAQSPGKWQRLAEKAVRKSARFSIYAARAYTDRHVEPCITPLPQDRRFRSHTWQQWPFNLIHQAFLLNQQWLHNLTTGIGGVSPHHEAVVSFVARQMLDTMSPVNYIATNPEVLDATARENGMNLLRGAMNFIEDWERSIAGKPPLGTEDFQPGVQVAVTPGEVVYRNRLIELIQYAPATGQVHAEPILIVPAWIMKYYILDLSPHNSLVKYLVGRGHTVFMISWHNPTEQDRDLDMEAYLRLGILQALDAVRAIVPERKINTVGYCLGGTLLSMAAAYLAQIEDDRLNSMTLLAAQTDFTEAGELTLFIDDSQLNYLEDIMWDQGYLDNRQMAGAFQLLRPHDLIWSLILQEYLLGGRQAYTDLMAWNTDATRMPYRMHSEYLHRLFLKNDLFAGRYKLNGRPISLGDIRTPIFAVATETDHVAPWKSVYKINLIADPDVTFLLTNGGHNAGIVSEPGHKGRHYRMSHRPSGSNYMDPENWFVTNPSGEGSWWPAWEGWLAEHNSGMTAPPPTGAIKKGYPPLGPAPGRYVLER
ncbi:PHA/PHB synthase family protein [Noviherbaspirillum sp.]|uniref:PHA/PHB synthase family protein n=1 Tax=Noviherbaspirillum sp. TaxID=1926288 RepID=UPI002D2E84B1|nr:alpha/beta fold hydrolase [Noviherbaspirillum sp.]HZW21073.1 alpha/beta fold hydrolase [Noviherbaspirillum sp.]